MFIVKCTFLVISKYIYFATVMEGNRRAFILNKLNDIISEYTGILNDVFQYYVHPVTSETEN